MSTHSQSPHNVVQEKSASPEVVRDPIHEEDSFFSGYNTAIPTITSRVLFTNSYNNTATDQQQPNTATTTNTS